MSSATFTFPAATTRAALDTLLSAKPSAPPASPLSSSPPLLPSDAKRHYLRARDYCSTSSHIVKVYLNFVNVCLHESEWDGVLAHIFKAKSMDDFMKSVRRQEPRATIRVKRRPRWFCLDTCFDFIYFPSPHAPACDAVPGILPCR